MIRDYIFYTPSLTYPKKKYMPKLPYKKFKITTIHIFYQHTQFGNDFTQATIHCTLQVTMGMLLRVVGRQQMAQSLLVLQLITRNME